MKTKYQLDVVDGRNITRNSADFLLDFILREQVSPYLKSKLVDVLWYFDIKSAEAKNESIWLFSAEYVEQSNVILTFELRFPARGDSQDVVFEIFSVQLPSGRIVHSSECFFSYNFGTPLLPRYAGSIFSGFESWRSLGPMIRNTIRVAEEYAKINQANVTT